MGIWENMAKQTMGSLGAIWGLYRERMNDLLIRLQLFCVFLCLEWLIKAWAHIPIRFFDIFGTFKMFTKSGPFHPSFITEILLIIQGDIPYCFCGNLISPIIHAPASPRAWVCFGRRTNKKNKISHFKHLSNFGKDGRRKTMKIRLTNP